MGENQRQPFQLSFNRFLRVGFQGSKVTSNEVQRGDVPGSIVWPAQELAPLTEKSAAFGPKT